MSPPHLIIACILPLLVIIGGFAAALVFGGPKPPPPMTSITELFKSIDFSDLPPLVHYSGADGGSLAYRKYGPVGTSVRGSIVLVHGSSASSNSMHILAKAFAGAGYAAYALDIRGHGASGKKGRIDYIGQLEDDLMAFCRAVPLPRPSTLAGFSAGGGFVLRFAGSAGQDEFQTYLLLSPFLGQDAPTQRRDNGGWVTVGLPRTLALSFLNSVGVRAFNDLPIISFALNAEAKRFLTPEYSFTLAANFCPRRDYAANIRAVHQPCAVIAGADDEVFFTDRFATAFSEQGKDWPVTLLQGVGHASLTLEPGAIETIVAAVEDMTAR